MALGKLIASWPLLRQADGDPLALGKAVRSERTQRLRPRTADADHVARSVCPAVATSTSTTTVMSRRSRRGRTRLGGVRTGSRGASSRSRIAR